MTEEEKKKLQEQNIQGDFTPEEIERITGVESTSSNTSSESADNTPQLPEIDTNVEVGDIETPAPEDVNMNLNPTEVNADNGAESGSQSQIDNEGIQVSTDAEKGSANEESKPEIKTAKELEAEDATPEETEAIMKKEADDNDDKMAKEIMDELVKQYPNYDSLIRGFKAERTKDGSVRLVPRKATIMTDRIGLETPRVEAKDPLIKDPDELEKEEQATAEESQQRLDNIQSAEEQTSLQDILSKIEGEPNATSSNTSGGDQSDMSPELKALNEQIDAEMSDYDKMIQELQSNIEKETANADADERREYNKALFGGLTNAVANIANLAATTRGAKSAAWKSDVPQWQNRIDTLMNRRESTLNNYKANLKTLQDQRRQLRQQKLNANYNEQKLNQQAKANEQKIALQEKQMELKVQEAAYKAELSNDLQLKKLDASIRKSIMSDVMNIVKSKISAKAKNGEYYSDASIEKMVDDYTKVFSAYYSTPEKVAEEKATETKPASVGEFWAKAK